MAGAPAGRAQEPPARPEPIATSGAVPSELLCFDALMLAFIKEREIPGAALAVAKDGRLVLARGYGWASLPDRRPVQPTSLFRVASLSKPLTAAAVMQLVDRGQLSLETRVFEILKLQQAATGADPFDTRWQQITILHCLQHTAGFDRSASYDPMFRSREIMEHWNALGPASPWDIIRYMVQRPLDFDPGARYAYSNFGYCLLGRVIERVTGRPYAAYVRDEVLLPLGIRQARLGKTLPRWRAADEVAYYERDNPQGPAVVGPLGQEVPLPYGAWYLEAMDSHGGWIASAVEMARFAAALEPDRCPILTAGTCQAMFARPAHAAGYDDEAKQSPWFYSCGWMLRVARDGAANYWHTGSLPGTAALMVRRSDRVCWAVLFNTRSGPDGQHLGRAIDPLLHEAASQVSHWPSDDLFARYLAPAE
jgi:N-acyl-D-amino-acid deacylase